MLRNFLSILRAPDRVLFQYEDSAIRFEEPDSLESRTESYDYTINGGVGRFTLYPSGRPIKRIKLRWEGDLSGVISVLGDVVERNYDISYGINMNSSWRSIMPDVDLPWYFHAWNGQRLDCYGVKTDANAIALFRVDERGINLWLDLRCGGYGTVLREPLVLVNITERKGIEGEDPFAAARSFCTMMCDKPVLPKTPLFGANNWYWAYGNISHDIVMEDTDNLMDICRDAKNQPYMVIDDGWQVNRYKHGDDSYNGGPWDRANSAFPGGMQETAFRIRQKGAIPGIWFRPLLTMSEVKDEYISPVKSAAHGLTLDPSHPEVLNMVAEDVKRITEWGYGLIKYDFTTFDAIRPGGIAPEEQKPFYNRSLPTCAILKNLYKTIQDAAGDAVIIGCSTINHILAGISASQRAGHDTSGRNYEITRSAASAAMLRLPQNNTFFNIDPDCPAFTERVPIGANLDFLELCARTGVATLASITPGILKGNDLNRARKIYEIASVGGTGAVPLDWLMHNSQSKYLNSDSTTFEMDWFSTYGGARAFSTWMN